MPELLKDRVVTFLHSLQDEITRSLESADGEATFREDIWERPGGGGGRTRILTHGGIFEKAGVNFSAVHGASPTMLQKDEHPSTFFATGVSLVLHPSSPMIPTVHANFRYFEQSTGEAWFGGGLDLTPYYLVEEDARSFHSELKKTCDKYSPDYYHRFKKWCDEYFYIKHRGETRGVGGLFFDRLGGKAPELEKHFEFVKGTANSFLPAYLPIVQRHRDERYTDDQKQWQLLRHGRYVEFNLVYDKGTLFGLETNGRTESILMSLPSTACWTYDYQPVPGSEEEKLIEILKQPRDWA
ncbi:MAG: oxygen-dependent coproporphyrinogen oxidase [Ignavibacteriota bacterium]